MRNLAWRRYWKCLGVVGVLVNSRAMDLAGRCLWIRAELTCPWCLYGRRGSEGDGLQIYNRFGLTNHQGGVVRRRATASPSHMEQVEVNVGHGKYPFSSTSFPFALYCNKCDILVLLEKGAPSLGGEEHRCSSSSSTCSAPSSSSMDLV